jgi:hypothetical protein
MYKNSDSKLSTEVQAICEKGECIRTHRREGHLVLRQGNYRKIEKNYKIARVMI